MWKYFTTSEINVIISIDFTICKNKKRDDFMDNILGKRIELERTRLGLNQIELAKKLNLSSSASISQYEKRR